MKNKMDNPELLRLLVQLPDDKRLYYSKRKNMEYERLAELVGIDIDEKTELDSSELCDEYTDFYNKVMLFEAQGLRQTITVNEILRSIGVEPRKMPFEIKEEKRERMNSILDKVFGSWEDDYSHLGDDAIDF